MVIRRRINIECLKKTSLDNPVAINFFTMLENSYSKNMKTLAVKTILNRMWKLGLYENKVSALKSTSFQPITVMKP